MRGMKKLFTFCAVAVMIFGSANMVYAGPIIGTFSFQNGELPWVSPDPSASIAGDTLSATLWSRTDTNLNPIYTGNSYIFTLASPVKFSDISSVSASYDILIGDFTSPGSPRFVFLLDKNSNGLLDDGSANVNIPWQYANSMGAGDTSAGFHTTGNIMTSSAVGWEIAHMNGMSNSWTTVANAMATVGNYNVLAISIVLDGGWSAEQGLGVNNFSASASVPEPATMLLLGLGLVGLAGIRRKITS